MVNELLHLTQILVAGSSLACIWRVFSRYFLVCCPPSTKKQNLQNAKFDLDSRSASKPADADVASSPNNMVLIFTYL